MAKKSEVKEKKPKRELDISDDERVARSERMKKLHAEGKAGPQFGKMGGRPRKKRAGEEVAEGASDDRKKILEVFRRAIDKDQPISIQMKGAEALLKAEEREGRLSMDEEEHVERMSGGDLAKFLAQKLSDNPVVRDRLMAQMEAEAAESEAPDYDYEGEGVEVAPDDETD